MDVWTRSARRWHAFRESLLFIPVLMTLGALALYVATSLADAAAVVERTLERSGEGTLRFLVFAGDAVSASSVLASIVGTWATIAGVVFSVTLITIQLSATKYSAQVIPVFEHDRLNQVVLGAFTSTFVYALLVLKSVRGGNGDAYVPLLGTNVAIVMAITSLFLLIAFIGNLTAYIRPTRFVDDYARSGVKALPAHRAPADLDAYKPVERRDPQQRDVHEKVVSVRAQTDGYVESIDWERLPRLLAGVGSGLALVTVRAPVGARVVEKEALLQLHGIDALDPRIERALCRCVRLDASASGRSPAQVVDTLGDIGVTALSGGATDVGVAKASLASILHVSAEALRRADETNAFIVDVEGREMLLVREQERFHLLGFHAAKRVLDKASREGYWDVGEAFAEHAGPVFLQAAASARAKTWEETLAWFAPVARVLFTFDDAAARYRTVRRLRAITAELRDEDHDERALDVEFIILEAARDEGVADHVREALAQHGG